MTSIWKYLCCDCRDMADDKRARGSAHYRRHKSNKNTWTRRKLLEGDDDAHFMNGDPRAYQMRTITDTPVRDLDNDNEEAFEERILDYYGPKKRPTIRNVFDKANEDDASVVKTTFPWMDDRFVPPERSRTRLGISSVQINAKRNDVRNNIVTAKVNTNRPVDMSVKNNVSEQQNRGIKQIYRNNYQLLNTHSNQTNVKQNGNVIKNNIVTAPNVIQANQPNHVRHVVSINNGNKRPMVFKESSSDVGVRRITQKSHQKRSNRIPMFEDCGNVNGIRYFKDTSSDIGPYRPKSQSAFHNASGSNEGDVSFSSEVTFRQQPTIETSRDLSMKRSSAPGIFSSKEAKYERIKSGKGKQSTNQHDLSMNESMYGYVPKAVQGVQASNALEGEQIDDFFMKLFHDRQMDKFGLLENAEIAEEDTESIPVIVTTLGSVEDLTKAQTSHPTSIEHVYETRATRNGTANIDNGPLENHTKSVIIGESRFNHASSGGTDSNPMADHTTHDINGEPKVNHTSSGGIESHGNHKAYITGGPRSNDASSADIERELNARHKSKINGETKLNHVSSEGTESESMTNHTNSETNGESWLKPASSEELGSESDRSYIIPFFDSGLRNKKPVVVKAKQENEVDTTHAVKTDLKGNAENSESDAVHASEDKTDTNEDQVIMIDFPPNLENDRKYVVRNVKHNQTTLPPPPAMLLTTLNQSTNKVMIKVDEVLY